MKDLLDQITDEKDAKREAAERPNGKKNSAEEDFFKNIEYYKSNDKKYTVVTIDDELKDLLTRLRGTQKYKGVKMNQLVSAIVKDFVVRNSDSIRESINESIPI